MKIFLYSITNKINGKIYYGKTIRGIDNRFDSHCRAADRGSIYALRRAIRKYGRENFKVRMLGYCRSNEAANKAEKSLIRQAREEGKKLYNMTDGGDGLCGYSYTKAQRKTLSRSMIGRPMTWSDKIHESLKSTPERYNRWKKRISEGMQSMSSERKKARGRKIKDAFKRMSKEKKTRKDERISKALKAVWKKRKGF